jgi:diguanylate cyclase (GGDEF)-like protein
MMRSKQAIWRQIFARITFMNTPIRSKFILFSLGVSFWFLVIAGAGLFNVRSRAEFLILLGAVLVAHVMLVLFAISITRSLTQPVGSMIEQIRILTKGSGGLGRIVVVSGDEIGELSHRFNQLLDTLQRIGNFRKVIEEDDSAQEVYERLSHVFAELGLTDHQLYDVTRAGKGMQLAVSTDGTRSWCNAAILTDSALCRAKKTGLPVWSAVYPRICKQFALDGRQHICLPLLIGGSTNGVAQFVSAADGNGLDNEVRTRVEAAQRFIQEALPVLEAKHLTEALRESALRDPLTRLYNRRFLEEAAASVTALARRRAASVGVLMCDLDHFKEVNDTYGHAVGDAVLRELAGILTRLLRTSDYAIRYGGEEFLVVLQDTEKGASVTIAERIRAAVAGHSFPGGGEVVRKTISIGVAEFPENADDLRRCVKLADAALYQAKARGRNQVVRYTADSGLGGAASSCVTALPAVGDGESSIRSATPRSLLTSRARRGGRSSKSAFPRDARLRAQPKRVAEQAIEHLTPWRGAPAARPAPRSAECRACSHGGLARYALRAFWLRGDFSQEIHRPLLRRSGGRDHGEGRSVRRAGCPAGVAHHRREVREGSAKAVDGRAVGEGLGCRLLVGLL